MSEHTPPSEESQPDPTRRASRHEDGSEREDASPSADAPIRESAPSPRTEGHVEPVLSSRTTVRLSIIALVIALIPVLGFIAIIPARRAIGAATNAIASGDAGRGFFVTAVLLATASILVAALSTIIGALVLTAALGG